MGRKKIPLRSSLEKLCSENENLSIYCKPLQLYNTFYHRSLENPMFLRRCLNYKSPTEREKNFVFDRSRSNYGKVVFNFKDCNNTLQTCEVTDEFSCPFCYLKCDTFKGLRFHLNASHYFFEYKYMILDEYQMINVSLNFNEVNEERPNRDYITLPYSFCSKACKLKRRRGKNKTKPLNVRFLPMDSPSPTNETDNGTAPVINELGGPSGTNSNTQAAIAQSSLDPDRDTKKRKLSAQESEAKSHLQKRKFYHSQTGQPMSLEEVMSGRDSKVEVDSDDVENVRRLLDDKDSSEDAKKFMQLWNSFVRRQRIRIDCHMPWACEAFSRFHEKELLGTSSLLWFWRIYMVKLWKYGLVDAALVNKCNTILENLRNKSNTNNNNTVDHQGNDISNKNIDDVDDDDDDDNNNGDK